MEKLTMTQFRNYCNSQSNATFTYDSSNAIPKDKCKSTTASFPCYLIGHYKEVIVMLNPNVICFKEEQNILQLSGIEEITINRGFYDTIHINCKHEKVIHTIIVDRPFSPLN